MSGFSKEVRVMRSFYNREDLIVKVGEIITLTNPVDYERKLKAGIVQDMIPPPPIPDELKVMSETTNPELVTTNRRGRKRG